MAPTTDVDALALFDKMFADADRALGLPAQLRNDIATKVASILDAEAEQQTRKIPAGVLKLRLPKGARLGSLEHTRLRTIHDLARSSPAEIGAVPGIGSATAATIYREAVAHQSRIRQDVRLRVDPDHRTSSAAALLTTLSSLRRVESAIGALAGDVRVLKSTVEPMRQQASQSRSGLARLFTSKAKKAEVEKARFRLGTAYADSRSSELRDRIARVIDSANTRVDVWREYELDAAAFNALLSSFTEVATPEKADASFGFVGDRLVSEISQIELDRTHMRSYLRAYQAFGARYILSRKKSILGDEMGLGKTVQALAVAAHLSAVKPVHCLVVCPASVLINWSNETRKHTTLQCFTLHGANRQSEVSRWIRRGGIAVTTFDTLKMLTITLNPAMVVVDEAHYIKNPDAQRSVVTSRYVSASDYAVLLSGTPMENRVAEFKRLVSYVQPSVAARIGEHDGLGGGNAFRKAVAPAYLRRNQADVLRELPDLIEVDDWVEFNSADTSRYTAAVASGNFMAMRQAGYPVKDGSRSAKLDRLVEIVEEAEQNNAKVIVFSFFKGVLGAVAAVAPGDVYGPLTGSTPTAARQKMVDDFTAHRGRAVLISQIEAGGVGLNIQAASVVILTEPQWKPSTEVQAIARAHRMGQVRTVQVHRLLAKNSVDERMREILKKKGDLFDEYARRSSAKERDSAAVDPGWDHAVAPLENDIMAAERARLGLAS